MSSQTYNSVMDRIVIQPDVCNGKPVVRGTRITAQTVLEHLAAGDSIQDVLEGYPSLTRDDVLACLRFSASLLDHRHRIVPLDENRPAA